MASSLIPHPQGCSHKFPSSQALLLLPQGTWLFMEGEGSPSSYRKPPKTGRSLYRLPVCCPGRLAPDRAPPHQAWVVEARIGQASLVLCLPGSTLQSPHPPLPWKQCWEDNCLPVPTSC